MPEQLHYDLLEALAKAEGTNPNELDVSLTEHTDIDSIEKLYNKGKSNPYLELDIDDYEVIITKSKKIRIKEK